MSSLGPGIWVGGGIAFVTIPALAGLPGQTGAQLPHFPSPAHFHRMAWSEPFLLSLAARYLAVLIITWVTTIPPWGNERTVEILSTRGTEQLLVPPLLSLALPREACVCSTNARRYSEHLVSEL